jgi:3-isopropylmalate/(R)-2-methylmalate dehydratase small subunit
MDWGFRAVLSTSFADIFRNNALKNGLLPVGVTEGFSKQLFELVHVHPLTQVTIDLPGQQVVLPDGRIGAFELDNFSKSCLLEGMDQLEYLLSFSERITAYEAHHERS